MANNPCLWRTPSLKLEELGNPKWAWCSDHTVNWNREGNYMRQKNDETKEKITMNWKLVRVIKVHANEMILASRIQKSNLALRWDRIWEDTRNLQGEKDAACAREKFRRICPDPDIEEEDMESIVYDYMRADHEGGNYRHVRAVFIFQAKKWTVAEFHDHGGPTAPPLKTLPFPTTTKRQESEKS